MNNPKEVVEMKHKFKMPSRIKNYKIEKEFCTIENGHICIANNININEKVLIKIYDKELIQYKTEELSLINNEIFMLRLINHRHCLKLYEIIESPSYVFLVMEYFNGITLSEFIKQKKKLAEDDALNIYKQIVSVLVYIHDMNIGHLNISSNNIYIDNANNIKIFEFKYSVFYSSKSKVKCECLGDKLFLSPELCLKKQCNPELSDIWSSAAILYMLAVGEHPFLTKNELDSQKSIMKGEFRLPTTMSKIMQDFFKTAFEVKEESRYTIEKMFKCALFRQKNITTDTLPLGLNVLSAKYPIDQRALTICKNYFNLDQDELKQKLFDNVFDPETSLYKQIVSKFTNKKVSSDGDLISKKYSNYVNNTKYYYDEKIVKKNIQTNLNKEFDVKQVSKEKEDDITTVQQSSLIKLDDLLQSYETYKKDPKSLEKRPKVNRKAEEEKKKEKQEAFENQKAKLEGKDKENKESKENTDKKSILKKKNSKVIQKESLNFGPDELRNKSKERKSVYDKKSNFKNLNSRRFSSNVNMDRELENSLEKFKNFQINQINKKSSMKKKYLNQNDIIEESKEEDENQKKKGGVKIKEEDYLEIPRRMPKRNKSLYQKKSEIKDDDDELDEKLDLELSRKSSRRAKSFYGKKAENNSLEKEEPTIVRKNSARKMKSKSFYQKKSIPKIDDKDKEKLKEENEILRKNSKKIANPSSQKKENDNNSLSSSFSLSEEKNDVHDIDSTKKNINSRKSNKNLKKVSFQANDFNFLENTGSKRESIEKKPSLKERSSIEKKPSLKETNDDFIKKKPSLKIRSSMKKDSIKIEEPSEKPENNNDNNNNLESSTKIESERKNSSNENKPQSNAGTEKKSKNETELKRIRKQLESKYASLAQPNISKSNKKAKGSTRKSVNINNEDMFKNQAVFLSKSELRKKKSKDDYNVNEKDIINEEEDISADTPKFKKKKEEKIKNEEEEQKKLEEEKKRKKEEEQKKKEEEDEINRRKEQEEKIKKEIEEENKRKEVEKKIHEKRLRNRKKDDDLERREKEDNEERQRIRDRERAEKLMEEERKQEEEEERKRQLEEEEQKKQKKEEEERRRLIREERDRRRKERDEEDRKKEKEDKIRKEKEKERLKKEEDDKIKKWKEEAKKKKENEEKKRIAEEERLKKEEEDERRARREENEVKRQLEEQENNRRLEEYKNKQKEEEDKRKKRENLRKQKEEEQRQKREKEAKERRNKFMKKDVPKKKGGDSSDSGSGSEDDDDSKNLKTLPNQDSNKMKKTFNFHSNPFDFFKPNENNENDSEEESSPRVKKKPKQRSKRTSNEEQPKKKPSVKAKYNDFLKFSQGDKIASESDGSESSSDEEEKKNNKNNEKKKLSKSIEVRKNSNNNKKNSLYNKFNNYFFHENTFSDDLTKNKKNKDNKDSKANQDSMNAKKGFYHYQNNPTKEEKRVVDKRFELRTVNTTGAERFNQLNTDTITEESHDNNKKSKEGKNKKNKFVKQNSVEVRKANELNGKADNDILSVKFKRGRNKNNMENRQNNSVAYNHDMNLENENNAPKSKANQNKNNLKKVKNEKDKEKEKNKKQKKAPKNIVQNLMTDFDQTMEEYSSIYATYNTSTKGAKAIKGFNEKNSKLKNSKSKLKTSKSKNLNSQSKLKTAKSKIKSNLKNGIDKKQTSKITSNNPLNNSVNEKSKNLNHSLNINNKDDKIRTNSMDKRKAKAKIKKDKEKDGKLKGKKGSNKDLNNLKNGNSNHASSNVIKIKRSTTNMSSELREEDLTLYRGQIDYNNVSIKNVEESIGDLMMKYKKKGFTCIKKSREQFIFVKGPNTHHVELMKLGNGLLYFCVTK